jgi:WD40 repeat protein
MMIGADGSVLRQYDLPYARVQFLEDPCFLFGIGFDRQNEIHIDRINLQGEIVQYRSMIIDKKIYDSFGYYLLLSPNRKWISYVDPSLIGVNELDPRYSHYLDIYVYNLEKPEQLPWLVTSNGGAPFSGAVWSSDSQLAFSDWDQNGRVQIYLMDLLSNRKTLLAALDLSHPNYRVSQLQFSPDEKYLAFTAWNNSGKTVVGVIRMEDRKVIWMNMPTSTYEPRGLDFWWNRESSQLLVPLSGNDPKKRYKSQLVAWYDASTGDLIRTFPDAADLAYNTGYFLPLENLEKVVMDGSPVGHEGIVGTYLYDIKKDSLEQIKDWPLLCCITYYTLVPLKDIRIEECPMR